MNVNGVPTRLPPRDRNCSPLLSIASSSSNPSPPSSSSSSSSSSLSPPSPSCSSISSSLTDCLLPGAFPTTLSPPSPLFFSFSTQSSKYLKYSILACNIASLCISTPWHAGIILFNTANSSFILNLLLRSINECAVFRAVLRVAAVGFVGCTACCGAVAVAATTVAFFRPPPFVFPFVIAVAVVFDSATIASGFGFICIIFLDLPGGGGSVTLLLPEASLLPLELLPVGDEDEDVF